MLLRYLFFFFLGIVITATNAHAVIEVNIKGGNTDPIPVVIPNLQGNSISEQDIGQNISSVIKKNLLRSGLFNVLDTNNFIGNKQNSRLMPSFAIWRSINANLLMTGEIKVSDNGKSFSGSFRLWDVYTGQQVTDGSWPEVSTDNWRSIAHQLSDTIYSYITGEGGYFNTKIVYIAETGKANVRIKRLAIMDQDGANLEYLSDGSYLVLTPRFSPTKQEFIYMSYQNGVPKVFLYNLNNHSNTLLGKFKGMSFAPRFAPDGKKVILSATLDGNSEIYELDTKTGRKIRLTFDSAIDTSPSYSPDGKRIVFNSDRGGSRQLYVMNRDGSNVHRISYGYGNYTTPVWSPRGDLIAFTKSYRGKFHIGVMYTDGSGERVLTESFLDEGPTWSPNGRVIQFTRQFPYKAQSTKGISYIYSIDLTGYNEHKTRTTTDASDPAWSPLITY